jgi:hypothetical protein
MMVSSSVPVRQHHPTVYVLPGGLVARRWSLLWQRPVLCGAGYGLILYGVMNYVVVPLSRAGHGGAKDPLWVGLSIVVHMFLIGVPIALAAGLAARHARQ